MIPGQQIINVGLPNNPANSDSLFQAFNTINNNFATLFQSSSPITTLSAGNGIAISNASSNAYSITNTGVTSIIAGRNVTITTLGGSPGSNGSLVINSTGTGNGNGGGTVDSVGVSSNSIVVTNSPITTSGNIGIELPVSGATPGTYVNANLSVDQFGRVTGISNGSSSGTVTSIAVTGGTGMAVSGSPIVSSGTITVTNTGVTSIVAGAGIAVNQANGAVTITNTGGGSGGGGTVTRVGVTSNTLAVSGSPVVSSGNIDIELPENITANLLTAKTINSPNIYTQQIFLNNSSDRSITLTTASPNATISSIVTQKARGNYTSPSPAQIGDDMLDVHGKAYSSFNLYQYGGGMKVTYAGAPANGSSHTSSKTILFSTSNANVVSSFVLDEFGNTVLPGKIQVTQASNVAQIPTVFTSRSRGTAATPVALQVGDVLARVTPYGYTGNGSTNVLGVSGYSLAGSTDWTISNLPQSSGALIPTDYTIRTVSSANTTLSSVFSSTGNLTIPGSFVGNTLIANTISVQNVSATTISGTLTSGPQPNITSVGTLDNLVVSGNISTGNISGNGALLTNVVAATATTAGTVTTAAQPNITSVGSLTALRINGNANIGGNIIGTLFTPAQPNITSVGTLSSLNVSGTISGTLVTAAQPNITSVGTLSSLNVSGNANIGGIETTQAATSDTTSVIVATIPIVINGVTYKIMLTQ